MDFGLDFGAEDCRVDVVEVFGEVSRVVDSDVEVFGAVVFGVVFFDVVVFGEVVFGDVVLVGVLSLSLSLSLSVEVSSILDPTVSLGSDPLVVDPSGSRQYPSSSLH